MQYCFYLRPSSTLVRTASRSGTDIKQTRPPRQSPVCRPNMFSAQLSSATAILPIGVPLSAHVELSSSYPDDHQQDSAYRNTTAHSAAAPSSRPNTISHAEDTHSIPIDNHSISQDGLTAAVRSQKYPNSTQDPTPVTSAPGYPAHNSSSNDSSSKPKRFTAKRLKNFVLENFMLLSFSLAAGLAMAWPVPGKAVASWSVADVRVIQALNNFLVFLISGLTLKSDDFRALLRHWLALVYGLLAILAVTPCFAFIVLKIPFQPVEFGTGLALFCIVPTTLGVGVALTAAAKGNQALALLLTVVTNLLGIVTVPYELRLVLSTVGSSAVSVDPANLVIKLVLTVLVPTVIGKLAREVSRHVQSFVTRYKTHLSLFSTLNLACIVWQTLSGARDTLLQQAFTSVLLIVVASSVLHLIMLALNGLMVSRYILKFPFREGVAVLIMSSQKSAPVAVTVISYLTPSLVQQGLLAIPCILGQLAQIFIGSALVKYLRKRADKGL